MTFELRFVLINKHPSSLPFTFYATELTTPVVSFVFLSLAENHQTINEICFRRK